MLLRPEAVTHFELVSGGLASFGMTPRSTAFSYPCGPTAGGTYVFHVVFGKHAFTWLVKVAAFQTAFEPLEMPGTHEPPDV